MISSTNVVVYIFFYLFFIHYLFTFVLCKLFIFVLYILRCYVLTLWVTLACYVLCLLNYTLIIFYCQKIDNQNCRGIHKYGLSFANKQISIGVIPKPKLLPYLVKSLHWLFLSCQRPDDERSRGVGEKSLFFADEENLSGGAQKRELLSHQVKSFRCQLRPSKQMYIELRCDGYHKWL